MNAKRILSMILSLVMLTSVFILGTTAAEVSPYKDVKTSRWSYNDIMYVTEKGLMNGTTADKFAPAETMTRAMVVTVLYRLQGSPEVEYKSTFTDVKNNKWFTDAVIWAAENKIVEGKGNGIFAPTETITREQLATIIMRYAPMEYIITEERADITGYADYKRVHDYAKDALSWANAIGLITGKTADTLAPREGATREQFAKILRCFKEYDSYKYELVYNSPKPLSTYTEKPYELVTDADIYVAVDGNDANPGTLDKPVATFAKAKEMVRELKKTAKDEIVVAFKAGDYGVLDNLQFTAEDSGTADVPVTYCAYGDGEVYFTNGIYIESEEFVPIDEADSIFFTEENIGNIMKVDLSNKEGVDGINSDSSLFNEDGFIIPARTPNKSGFIDKYYPASVQLLAKEDGPYTRDELIAIAKGELEPYEGFDLKDGVDQYSVRITNPAKKKLDSYRSLDGVLISGYISKVWSSDNLPIESYDKETGIVKFSKAPDHGFVNIDDSVQQIYIENVSEELDAYGEYWLDTNTKTLYVYAPKGEYLISTHGSFLSATDADYLTFKKLNFRGCSYEGEHVGAITADVGADNFTMDQCTVKYVSTYYAFNGNRCLYTTITNSEFAYCYFTALDMTGPRDKYGDEFTMVALESSGLLIENNLIHDVGLIHVGVEASGIHYDHHVAPQIRHNEIYNSSRYAISCHQNIDSVIEYNYIHDCMQNSADGGSVYFAGTQIYRGNILRYNIITDGFPSSAVHTGGVYALYMDDYHSNGIVYGNVIYNAGNCAIMDNNGRDHDIHDNVIISTEARHGGFFSHGARFFDISEYAELEQSNATRRFLFGTDKYSLPDINSELGKKWLERWPELYDIKTIMEYPDSYKNTALYTKSAGSWCNNYGFGISSHNFNGANEEKCTIENNIFFTLAENPIFVNPSIGDYSIREGADFADNHFAQIGRY